MQDYKKEFIEFMVKSGVLTFGDFVTKSGRKTPYFINTGNYGNGYQMAQLGKYYARTLEEELKGGFDVLFGPAYKGIPLVVATSVALWNDYNRPVGVCFNRKEAKNHGETGILIGQKLKDANKVVIVEDVTTAGTSIRDTIPILKAAADVDITAMIVSVDRKEKGSGGVSALAELRKEFGIKTFSIVTIDDIVEYLYMKEINGKIIIDDIQLARIKEYRAAYGAS